MTYLLDTNACIRYLNSSHSKVTQRLSATNPTDVRLCSVVKMELYRGAYKSQRQAGNLATLQHFFNKFAVLPFDDVAAEIAGREAARLELLGTSIGSYDLLIAATALANNLTVVTHNTREFSRVIGLQIEDWES